MYLNFNLDWYYKQEVIDINFLSKRVITQTQYFSYDILVLAVGSRTKFIPSIKGLQHYAHGVKSLHKAIYFKHRFELALFKKIQENGHGCSALNIVVVGAGLSGVEISAQMASYANEFYCNHHFLCRKLNIVLISSSEEILPTVASSLQKKAQKRLENLDVNIVTGVKVEAIDEKKVYLSDGSSFYKDFVLFTGGIEVPPLIHKLVVDKNKNNCIEVEETMLVKNKKDVFALGDCAVIYKAKAQAPTADRAEQMATLCAANIQRLGEQKPLLHTKISSRGLLIALGRRYAVGQVLGFSVSGKSAYIIKKLIEKFYLMRLQHYNKKGCLEIEKHKEHFYTKTK